MNMRHCGYRIMSATLVLWSCIGGATNGQVLNSWEGGLEGWTPQNGHSLSIGTTGVTHGSSSLRVNLTTDNFQRWGARTFSGGDLAAVVTAAAIPRVFRIQFDVTYDTSFIPQGSINYINQQLAMNTNSGWSQVDFLAPGDQRSGSVTETITLSSPLSRFGTVHAGTTSLQMLFATNSNWGSGVPGSIFMDNLRITQLRPDLNQDNVLNADDWQIFMANHLTNPVGTSNERFLLGDLDSDGTNGFEDFLTFKAAYDYEMGTGAFQAMLESLPEPASFSMMVGLLAVGLFLRRRRGQMAVLTLIMSTGISAGPAQAQLLHSWENGLEGWAPVNFNAVPVSASVSTLHPTHGTRSLAITHGEDGFSWSTAVTYGIGAGGYNIFGDAANLGLNNFAFEFDITYDTTAIPQGEVSFINMSLALNSGAGWHQFDNLGLTNGQVDETMTVSVPLSVGDVSLPAQTGFYQINLAFNGDWGLSPATFYIDNMRLTQISVEETLNLEVNRGTGEIRIVNESATRNFPFNYYRIQSPGNSLDVANWYSLDDQGIGATGGGGPLDGWTKAGGSNAGMLAEAFLLGHSTLAPGQFFTLGNAYNRAVDAMDLVFQYQDIGDPGVLKTGTVNYIGMPTITGDFNNDGVYDCADVDALTSAIAGGMHPSTFDLTGDGLVNLSDLTAWRAEAGGVNLPSGNPYLVGDANLDGVVDGSDFGVWNANKFTSVAAWCKADFNADGVVDGSDFGAWNAHKFTSALDQTQGVPEPIAAWALAWIGGFLLHGRRRRGR